MLPQKILANPLISLLRLAWILLLLCFVTTYTPAIFPAHVNYDIANILLILFIHPRLPTNATPNHIPVLTTHSSLDSINTIIFFATLVTFPSFSDLNILATVLTQPILANHLISLRSQTWVLLLLLCVTIYRLATLPKPADHDIPNILLFFWIFLDLLIMQHLIIFWSLLLTPFCILLILLFPSLHLLHSVHFLI